jgi:hypothetical protein
MTGLSRLVLAQNELGVEPDQCWLGHSTSYEVVMA